MSLSRTDRAECGLDWMEERQKMKWKTYVQKKKVRNEPPVAFAFWLSLAIRGWNTSTRCTHHTFFFLRILLITRRKEKRSTFTERKTVGGGIKTQKRQESSTFNSTTLQIGQAQSLSTQLLCLVKYWRGRGKVMCTDWNGSRTRALGYSLHDICLNYILRGMFL